MDDRTLGEKGIVVSTERGVMTEPLVETDAPIFASSVVCETMTASSLGFERGETIFPLRNLIN